MLPLLETATISFATIVGVMIVLWLVASLRRDASIVDPCWGMGFVVVAWLACWLNAPLVARGWLLIALVTVWGARLSLYLLWRNWGHGEDRRYVAMRDRHGAAFLWISLVTVFLLQGVILWFVSLPVQAVIARPAAAPLGLLDAVGVIVWAVGTCFETVGDWQLARFRADGSHDGRVMDRGLWRYTRHPNYFGDFCVWWGLYFIAGSGGAWWTLGSPLLMSYLLMKVSGVALLEATIGDRRREYADYKKRTNAFFPGPPKAI